LALALGFAVVWFFGGTYAASEGLARYTAIAVLAGLDTILGGLRAQMTDDFDDVVFVSGFFVNALLAGGLVLLGERLGLATDLGDERVSAMMIAAVVVFGARIFNNLGVLRRLMIERWRDSHQRPSQDNFDDESDDIEGHIASSDAVDNAPSLHSATR
jgi:small basic protein